MTSPFVHIVTETDSLPEPPAELALKTGYEPDRFQKFAIAGIEAGENILVTAKTGSGKTFVGEYQIAKSLSRGGRVFYTTPIKSLSNQKFHDLKNLFPEASVGILTGDIKFRPDAQILVMTTEILRNLLYKRGTATESVGSTALVSLDGLDAVVFDEVHYINDPDRGHVWEETLILLPPSIKLILLSATLSNPYMFAEWLGELKKVPIWLISTLWRAVPLEHCVLDTVNDYKPIVLMDSKNVFYGDRYSAWAKERREGVLAHERYQDKVKAARLSGHEGPVAGKTRPKSFEHELNETLNKLSERSQLPAIVFVFSRAGCERLAKAVTSNFLDSSESASVKHIWNFHLARYRDSLETSPQFHSLLSLAERGIAYHHSGLLPFMKEILEILFSKGLIRVLFATETFAVGINMPTKTVVFTALEKFTDGGIRGLTTSEYLQMAGRAGRRGKDDKGLVLYLPQRDPLTVSEVQRALTGGLSGFDSRMNFHYDFVLKMANGDRLPSDLVAQSYWYRLQEEEVKKQKHAMGVLEERVVRLESSLTVDQRAALEQLAEIANRKANSQNSKKKAAQREWDRWQEDHRGPVWTQAKERYDAWVAVGKDLTEQKAAHAALVERGTSVPEVLLRVRLLKEFGYVSSDGSLTLPGRLASEVNEGHPFLMTSFFLRQSEHPMCQQELVTTLALFLGEYRDDDRETNKCISDLAVSSCVKAELLALEGEASKWCSREENVGLVYDPKFWGFSTEWIEPVATWLEGGVTLAGLAAEHGLFEGNCLKALMKLAGLVEEMKALASLTGALSILNTLEGVAPLILRDVVIAESLYLRL